MNLTNLGFLRDRQLLILGLLGATMTLVSGIACSDSDSNGANAATPSVTPRGCGLPQSHTRSIAPALCQPQVYEENYCGSTICGSSAIDPCAEAALDGGNAGDASDPGDAADSGEPSCKDFCAKAGGTGDNFCHWIVVGVKAQCAFCDY